jgi:hypothetical protein
MIGATYPVLAPFADSAQSLGKSLSLLHRVRPKSPLAPRPRPLFSRYKPLLHLPAGQFSRRIRLGKLQKAIQYPETRSGSVQ